MAEKPALTRPDEQKPSTWSYDRKRSGIVVIYGTVKDFRPFVEAFRRAFPGESSDRKDVQPSEAQVA